MVHFISDSTEKKKQPNKAITRRKTIVDSQAHHDDVKPYAPGKGLRTREKKPDARSGNPPPKAEHAEAKKDTVPSMDNNEERQPTAPKSRRRKRSRQKPREPRQDQPRQPNESGEQPQQPPKTPHEHPTGPSEETTEQPTQTQAKSRRRRPKKKTRPPEADTPRAREEEAPRKKSEEAKPAAPWFPTDYVVPEKEGAVRFHDLNLPDPILHAIADLKFEYCTPIQAQALPPALDGQDVSGRAQTGTGKTAAFLITIFTRLLNNPLDTTLRKATPRALVIAPTRELATQIGKEAEQLATHTGLHIVTIYGGKEYAKQKNQLLKGAVDLVIATPGRLLDLKSRHDIHLGHVEIMVIDEADRMLDMGFIPSVRQIINSTPPRAQRQTMLFSATLTPDIIRLAGQWMKDPVTVEIEPQQVAAENIDQRVYIVTNKEKFSLLFNLLQKENPERALIFVNRRDTADFLMKRLNRYKIPCSVLSGALPQNQRERTLEAFRKSSIKVLVATDVAGRGLHVEGISHVFNYNIPVDAEDYVHRIGRTGRAGSEGVSISFACDDESFYIPDIEAYLGRELVCLHPDAEWLAPPPPLPDGEQDMDEKTARKAARRQQRSSQSRRPRRPGKR
ncbi:MAG: DEAD/DEAH box helicase [Spartobacteria bacterium]|nr:DEAD/DEAH box helicase [Spartobacteria bacterium]